MSRDLTTDMVTELTGKVVHPALLAVMEFDSGTLRVWSGYSDLVWNGDTYTGGGNLVAVSSFQETEDLDANGLTVTLSGVPSDQIALALTERTRGRPFRLYLGMVTTGNVMLDDPYRLFTGLMDVMEATDTGATSSLTVTVENRLIVGQRVQNRRYTSQDQKKTYPTDLGFDLINQLQDKSIVW